MRKPSRAFDYRRKTAAFGKRARGKARLTTQRRALPRISVYFA
jgi:hypothetical protein